jgi:hypothetical protein
VTAAIYSCKSTEQSGIADEQKSVARQIEHARRYAIAKGWRLSGKPCAQSGNVASLAPIVFAMNSWHSRTRGGRCSRRIRSMRGRSSLDS